MRRPSPWRLLLGAGFSVPLAACGTLATVPSGHTGVLWTPGGGVQREPLGEGVHVIDSSSRVELYNVRVQERSEDLVALSADGVPIVTRASVFSFHPAPGETPALDREIGPDYYRVLIRPLLHSLAGRVFAGCRADQLDTPHVRQAEQQIAALAARELRTHHVVLDGVDLRSVVAAAPQAYQAVVATSAAEQEALAAPHLRQIAQQRAAALREAAAGVAASHALVGPTLSPTVLADSRRRAVDQLLVAPTTTVTVLDHKPAKTAPLTLEIMP